jgi:hypothetical protein
VISLGKLLCLWAVIGLKPRLSSMKFCRDVLSEPEETASAK